MSHVPDAIDDDISIDSESLVGAEIVEDYPVVTVPNYCEELLHRYFLNEVCFIVPHGYTVYVTTTYGIVDVVDTPGSFWKKRSLSLFYFPNFPTRHCVTFKANGQFPMIRAIFNFSFRFPMQEVMKFLGRIEPDSFFRMRDLFPSFVIEFALDKFYMEKMTVEQLAKYLNESFPDLLIENLDVLVVKNE